MEVGKISDRPLILHLVGQGHTEVRSTQTEQEHQSLSRIPLLFEGQAREGLLLRRVRTQWLWEGMGFIGVAGLLRSRPPACSGP